MPSPKKEKGGISMENNRYLELKRRHEKELNDFPMFFAFNKKQFEEGMEKLGLEPGDTDKVYRLSNTGGFYKKVDAPKFKKMFDRREQERQDAINADETGEGYIYEMFQYELANHEYGYTGRIDDTLEALGLTLEEVKGCERLSRGLALAREDY